MDWLLKNWSELSPETFAISVSSPDPAFPFVRSSAYSLHLDFEEFVFGLTS